MLFFGFFFVIYLLCVRTRDMFRVTAECNLAESTQNPHRPHTYKVGGNLDELTS
jgi:hypothetical protein